MAQTAQTSSWKVIRIYTYGDKDEVILKVVAPAITSALQAGELGACYFNRHWRMGSHVRLYVNSTDVDPSQLADVVTTKVRSLGSKLGEAPDEKETSPTRTALVSIEDSVWRHTEFQCNQPAGTVRVDEDDADLSIWGNELLLNRARRFFGETRDQVVSWLRDISTGALSRDKLTFDLLALASWLADPVAMRSHTSYAAHVLGLIRVPGDWKKFQDTLKSNIASNRSVAVTELRSLLNTLESSESIDPAFQGYLQSLASFWYDTREGLQLGLFKPESPSEAWTRRKFEETWARVEMKMYGRRQADRDMRKDASLRMMSENSLFGAWRIGVNLVYCTLNQLGVQALKRFFVCGQVADACESVFGYRSAELASELTKTGDVSNYFTGIAALPNIPNALGGGSLASRATK